MIRNLFFVSCMMLVSGYANANCPNLSGVFTNEIMTLTVLQDGCNSVKEIIDDNYMSNLTTTFKTDGLEYLDPNFPNNNTAGSFASKKAEFSGNSLIVSYRRQAHRDASIALSRRVSYLTAAGDLVIADFETKWSKEVNTSTMLLKRR